MKENSLLRSLSRLFRGRSGKFWVAIIALMMTGTATAAVMAWDHPSVVGVQASHANVAFSTTVIGVSTNSNQTPLLVEGSYYNMTNIANFKTVSNGNGGVASSVALNIGNYLPGDYAEFQVTITNTGTTTLDFTNYTVNDAAYNSTTGAFVPPSMNVTGAMNGTPNGLTAIAADTYSTNFGNIIGTTGTTYAQSLVGHSYWSFDWGSTTSSTIPAELHSGQSFTYSVFVGLGSTAPYPPTNAVFTLSIPLSPAR